jgi:hypothetical protein
MLESVQSQMAVFLVALSLMVPLAYAILVAGMTRRIPVPSRTDQVDRALAEVRASDLAARLAETRAAAIPTGPALPRVRAAKPAARGKPGAVRGA